MWDLWHFGNKGGKNRPLKFLEPLVQLNKTADRNKHAKVVIVMKAIAAKCEGLFPARKSKVNQLNSVESDALFDKAINALMVELCPGKPKKRRSDLSIVSIYNSIKRKDRASKEV